MVPLDMHIHIVKHIYTFILYIQRGQKQDEGGEVGFDLLAQNPPSLCHHPVRRQKVKLLAEDATAY